MKIAVCDDQQSQREIIVKFLLPYKKIISDLYIDEYSCGEDLLCSIHNKEKYDLIFLDIILSGINGINTAKEIEHSDSGSSFIFVTNYGYYTLHAFDVQTVYYLMKPVRQDEFRRAFEKFLDAYRKKHSKLKVLWQNSIRVVEIGDIVYVENGLHHTNIFLKSEIVPCNKNISYYESILSGYNFFRCHHSILINFQYVKSINDRNITTTLGSSVDMSVRRKKECRNAFLRYLSETI